MKLLTDQLDTHNNLKKRVIDIHNRICTQRIFVDKLNVVYKPDLNYAINDNNITQISLSKDSSQVIIYNQESYALKEYKVPVIFLMDDTLAEKEYQKQIAKLAIHAKAFETKLEKGRNNSRKVHNIFLEMKDYLISYLRNQNLCVDDIILNNDLSISIVINNVNKKVYQFNNYPPYKLMQITTKADFMPYKKCIRRIVKETNPLLIY